MGLADELRAWRGGRPSSVGGSLTSQLSAWKKQQGQPLPEYTSMSAASTIATTPLRLQQAQQVSPTGEIKPSPAKPPTVLQRLGQRGLTLLSGALDILDRPSAAVRTAVTEHLAGKPWGQAVSQAGQAFLGRRERPTGEDVLRQLAQRGAPLASSLLQTKAGTAIGGIATEIVLDPTTYLGFGAVKTGVTRAAPLAKRAVKEIAEATGKQVSERTAQRLLERAIAGEEIPGRLGAALKKAMGVEMEARPTGWAGYLAKEAAERAKPKAATMREEAKALAEEAAGIRKQAAKFSRSKQPEAKQEAARLRQQAQTMTERAKALEKQAAESVKVPKSVKPTMVQAPVQEVRKAIPKKIEPERIKKYIIPQLQKGITEAQAAGDTATLKKLTAQLESYQEAVKAGGRTITQLRYMPPAPTRTALEVRVAPFGVGGKVLASVDVTPVVTKLGSIVRRSPTATTIVDGLGRLFSFNYVPSQIQGAERIRVRGGQRVVLQRAREAAAEAQRGLGEAIQEWKGTPRHAAEQAYRVIEEGKTVTPEVTKAAAKAQEMFAKDAATFASEGIDLDLIENYFSHLYRDSPEKVRAVLKEVFQRRMPELARAPGKPYFTYERFIDTIAHAEKLGLHPIKDARVVTAVHRALTRHAATLNQLGKDLIQMKGVVARGKIPGWRPVTGIPALKGYYMHPEVANTFDNLWPVLMGGDKELRAFTRYYNTALSAWKGLVTGASTGFHARNFSGNVLLNMADGVWNPLRYPQAAVVLTRRLPYIELSGRRVPVDEIVKWFENEGLVGQGMFREVLASSARPLTSQAEKAIAALERGGFGRVMYFARHPLTAGREFGEATDTLSRMANFLHHLDEGLSPAEAAARTRRALFDYSELTQYEKAIKRWAVPFYAWRRKALPRMMEMLLGSPGLFTGLAHTRAGVVNIMDVDESHLPDWLRDQQGVPLYVDQDGNIYYLNLSLPITELSTIHGSGQETLREAASLLGPPMRPFLEAAFGQELQTDRPLVGLGEEGASLRESGQGALSYALRQLGPLGRALTQSWEAEQRRRKEAVEALKGQAPELPPKRTLPFWARAIGVPVTVQHPASWARQDIWKAQKAAVGTTQRLEQQGVLVPSYEEVQQKPSSLAEGLRAYMARKEVGRLSPTGQAGSPGLITASIRATGVNASWTPWMWLLMNQESGGNVVAYDPATKAVGPFRMTPERFRQYAAPGMTDIWNPVHNTVAAIRYIKAKYGHPSRIPFLGTARYGGY